MASIEKRSENTWRLTVEAGYKADGSRNRERKAITVEDPAVLKSPKRLKEFLNDELVKFKMEVESGEYIKPEKMTVNDFIEKEWKVKYAEKELSPLTYKTYCHHIKNHIIPTLGHQQFEDIKTMNLVTLINDLQKPGARKDGRKDALSGRTVVYIYNVLRNVFTQAKEWRLIKVNPMDGVKKPKFVKRKAAFYEADEARAVIKALYSEPMMWRTFMLGSLLGGCRRGEMIALEWSDVLFDQSAIHIQKSISLVQAGHVYEKGTKNDEDRFVDLPEWYMKELELYHREWKKQKLKSEVWEAGDREYLFHGGTGKPLYHTTPTRWWREFVANHGLRYIRLHDLRHSSATLLIEAGASMKAIQERLGHKQKQTTDDIYAHVTKKVSRELANKFNKFDPSKKTKAK